MTRVAGVLIVVALAAGMLATGAQGLQAPTGWDGTNPFRCELQQAGLGATVPHPDADPYCVEFDKRQQNITQLGVVDFLLHEPARVAAAVPKCFYFQSDHWRGSIVQADGTTKTYEFDGHYFFDKARAEGGAWVTNFNINGRTFDPSSIPGIPAEFSRYMGPGTGGVITRNDIPAEPDCIAKAADAAHPVYAAPPADAPAGTPVAACPELGGAIDAHGIGPVRLGDTEARVRAALGAPAAVRRGYLRYCAAGGGALLVGEMSDRSGNLGTDAAAPVALLLTTGRATTLRGVGVGSSARAVARAFPHAVRHMRVGQTRVLGTRRGSGLLIGIRGGRVRYLAVADRTLAASPRTLRALLARAG